MTNRMNRWLRPVQLFVGLLMVVAVLLTNQPQRAQAATGCIPGPYQVALFKDINYGGQCVIKDVDSYPSSSYTGLPNDSLSSIKVGVGAWIMVFRDANYRGTSEHFSRDDPDLRNNRIGNDEATSLKVFWG